MTDEVVAPDPAVIEQNTSGVVGALAEALAQHQFGDWWEVSKPAGKRVSCSCEWVHESDGLFSWEAERDARAIHREHQASVVADLPNIAIVPVIRGDWAPGRWWRVIAPDNIVWCETSDELEARAAVRDGDVLERLFDGPHLREWRAAAGGQA